MAARVKPADRQKHSATGDGRFPVATKAQAQSALKLRGHAGSPAARRAVIRKAARFVPAEAQKAREADKKAGKI